MTTQQTIEERVAELERVTRRLASSTESLRRGQRRTSADVRRLEGLVAALPAAIETRAQEQLDAQTAALGTKIAESETRNAERTAETYKDLAREWAAPAIIFVSVCATVVAGVIVKLILSHYGVG